ncbi:MAG: TRAP transporter small permease [Proteobacteria bacterium]|nr:TRAP transporter small permease [Pseudomonadota bacterium]
MDASLPLMIGLAAASALILCWLLRAAPAGRHPVARAGRLLEVAVGLFLMLGMLYAGTLQVVVRYAPAGALFASWTEEFARLMLIWMTFWGAAMVQRTGSHMAVGVFYDVLPGRAQRIVSLGADVVVLAVLVVLVKEGWQTATLQIGQTMITLDVSIAAFAYAVPVGCTLMLAYVVIDLGLRLGVGRGAEQGSGNP